MFEQNHRFQRVLPRDLLQAEPLDRPSCWVGFADHLVTNNHTPHEAKHKVSTGAKDGRVSTHPRGLWSVLSVAQNLMDVLERVLSAIARQPGEVTDGAILGPHNPQSALLSKGKSKSLLEQGVWRGG